MFRFETELWLHAGNAAWHFVTVPADVSDDIAYRSDGVRRGFGSVRVRVRIGSSTWLTSVFPDKKRGAKLPIKRDIRTGEGLVVGQRVTVVLDLAEATAT